MKIEIKSHGDKVTDFYNKEIGKVSSYHICLAVTSLDSARKKDESYYTKVFLKECKYIEEKVIWYINGNLSDEVSHLYSNERGIKSIGSLKFY